MERTWITESVKYPFIPKRRGDEITSLIKAGHFILLR
jgi:hypothetical protein